MVREKKKGIYLPKCKVKLQEIWLIFDPTVSKPVRLQQVIASSFRVDSERSASCSPLNRLYRVTETSYPGKRSDPFLQVGEQSHGNL